VVYDEVLWNAKCVDNEWDFLEVGKGGEKDRKWRFRISSEKNEK
jgi:hypothetical protein